MTTYYIEQDNKIVLFDNNKTQLQNTLRLMPQYKGLKILETDRPIIDFEFADTDGWKSEQARKERERLDMLNLTAADVERAIYKAKGMDFDDILELVKDVPDIDLKSLKIELKANNFYRGNPWIDMVGSLLGYSSDDLDYLFENKEFAVEDSDEGMVL